jgi:hypothetical protein
MNRYLTTWCAIGLLALVVGRADEPVVFSKPTDNLTEKANAFMEQQPHKLSSGYNAPKSVFEGKPRADFDILPGYQPPRPLSPDQIKAMQKDLDQRKNWTLMTPEEILGVPTTAKIMGIPDPDQNLTTEERYFKRQNNRQESQRSASATNAFARAGNLNGQDDGLFRSQRGGQKQNSSDGFAGMNGQNRTDRFGVRAAGGMPDDEAMRRADSPWSTSFNVPAALPKPDKAALAQMERFRALMEPSQPLAPTPSLNLTTPTMPTLAAPNPNFQKLADFNAGGNSFKPVRDSASRPTGIMPLPTVTGERPAQFKQPKPKPLVDPPPWVVEQNNQNNNITPKPGVFLQRKI